MTSSSRLRCGMALAVLLAASLIVRAADSQPDRTGHANYKQAFRFNGDYIGQFVYSTSVAPQWIGKTDAFWYSYRTSFVVGESAMPEWHEDPVKIPLGR